MEISQIIRTKTFQHTALVTGATVVNDVLGFVFYFLLARFFDPLLLGAFMIAVTVAGFVTDVATVGTDTGVINFVGRHIQDNKVKALKFLKLAFEIKVIVSFVVIVFGFLLSQVIATYVFGKPNLNEEIRIGFVVAASLLIFGFGTSALQALQKFYHWGFINIFSNSFRLIFVSLLFTLGILTVRSGLIIYLFFPLIAFFVSLVFLPNFFKLKGEERELRSFLNYNKWVAIFTLIAALASRLDLFFVTRISGVPEAGVYSVAVTLTSVVPQIAGAIGTVVAPKLAGLQTKKSAIEYIKKLQIFVSGLSLAAILAGLIFGYVMIFHFYKIDYHASFLAYVLLLVAQVFFLFSIPSHMATMYYFSYPKLFVLISLVNIVLVSVLCVVLIPIWGINGAAVAILIGNISNFLIPAFWVIYKFRQ